MEDKDRPLYMISVAAELAGVHPQTLRIYEQKGLVSPQRTRGNTRMYSQALKGVWMSVTTSSMPCIAAYASLPTVYMSSKPGKASILW